MNTRFILILLSLTFSGCSLLYSYSDNLPQRIESWVAENKYNTALNTIDYIKPTHKDYRIIQNKKKIIKKQMIDYENMAIEKSNFLASQGDWIKAINLLQTVASNIIDKSRIEKHHEKLLSQRQIVIAAYEKDILYNQAANLIEKMTLYKKIKKIVSTKERNQLNISKFDELREETSLKLTRLSEQQYKKNEYDNSLSTIDLALKLNPDKDIITRLNITNQHIIEATKKQNISHFKKAQILLSKLSQGYSHAILKDTKKTIAWLNKNKKQQHAYPALIVKLNKHLTKVVKQRFEAARNLYSKGKTQEALSIWLELKELEPDNVKLLSHIERAEKVLNKFEELSNKPKK